jgi:23S rRNA (pseudouridine1915-N3)-methyltransferase
LKFSDIKQDQWIELKPYLDTCLLPLTGLTGAEEPWEVTQALEQLRDVMDHIEIPYTGRVVTYPSMQYITNSPDFTVSVNYICEKLREGGFSYVILITADRQIANMEFREANLFINPDISTAEITISERVQNMWNEETENKIL